MPKRKSISIISLSIFLTILICSISVLSIIAYAFYCNGIDLFKTSQNRMYYAIEISATSNYSKAEEISNQSKLSSCAGYIYKDDNYKISSSCYFSLNDANSVLEKIKTTYPRSKIYVIKINPLELSPLSTTEKENFKDCIKNLKNVISSYLTMSLSLDKNEISLNDVFQKNEKLLEQCSSSLTKLNNSINAKNKNYIYKFNTNFNKVTKKMKDINKISSTLELSSILKYIEIDAIINYSTITKLY